jgi:hypothetical protein
MDRSLFFCVTGRMAWDKGYRLVNQVNLFLHLFPELAKKKKRGKVAVAMFSLGIFLNAL